MKPRESFVIQRNLCCEFHNAARTSIMEFIVNWTNTLCKYKYISVTIKPWSIKEVLNIHLERKHTILCMYSGATERYLIPKIKHCGVVILSSIILSHFNSYNEIILSQIMVIITNHLCPSHQETKPGWRWGGGPDTVLMLLLYSYEPKSHILWCTPTAPSMKLLMHCTITSSTVWAGSGV